MILILTEKNDIPATKVTEYLFHFKILFLMVDVEDTINIINKITINNKRTDIIFKHKNNLYSVNQFDIIWNRRGYFRIKLPDVDLINTNYINFRNIVKKQLEEERETLLNYIYYKMSEEFNEKRSIFYSFCFMHFFKRCISRDYYRYTKTYN